MKICKFLRSGKAAFLSGKAYKRMEKGNYRGAAIVLMEVCREKPDEENIEYLYYSLGQCHFNLGQLKTAIYWLSKSFELYTIHITTNTNLRYQKCYRDVIEFYCKLLRIDGNTAKADKIVYNIDFGS
jgi:tetratricopeptide (TPR) repeat protein